MAKPQSLCLSDEDLLDVCCALWSWQMCSGCSNGGECLGETCPMSRWKRIYYHLHHYKQLLVINEPEGPTAFGIRHLHLDLLGLVKFMKGNPDITRKRLRLLNFGAESQYADQDIANQHRVISLAVKAFTTIDDSAIHQQPWTAMEDGFGQRYWNTDESLFDFIISCLPSNDETIRYPAATDNLEFVKIAIRAKNLRNHAGLRFVPTDDISCHLNINHRSNTVEIFHHAAFLKEHLILTKDLEDPTPMRCLAIGALPRQLVLEVLESLQTIIFPKADHRSRQILESCVTASLFDPDCLRLDFAETRKEEEGYVKYYYLKNKLLDLFEEIQNPRPQNGLQKWLERRSRARHLTLLTLAGILTAVFIGITGLVLTAIQVWIAWRAWKYPVPQPIPSESTLQVAGGYRVSAMQL